MRRLRPHALRRAAIRGGEQLILSAAMGMLLRVIEWRLRKHRGRS